MTRSREPARAKATLVGCGAILLWSGLAVLTAASGPVPPFELAALTFCVGGAVGLVYAACRGRLSALRQPVMVWVTGVAGLFGYHALYFAALKRAPPAQAGLIACLWPLLIVLLSGPLAGEAFRVRHLAGAILGLGGVTVLRVGQQGGGTALGSEHAVGYALAFVAALVWSTYSVLMRRYRTVPTEAVAGFCVVTAGLALLCHLALETTVWPATSFEALAILALGLGPVGLAFLLWDHDIKQGDIQRLGVMSYAAPVASTLLLVLNGYAKRSTTLGTACVMISAGAIVSTGSGSRRSSRTAS